MLDTAEKIANVLWQGIWSTITEIAVGDSPYEKQEKKCKRFSHENIRVAKQGKAAKAAGKWEEARKLNADFQRVAKKDHDIYCDQLCKQLEEDCMKGHARKVFAHQKDSNSIYCS